MKGGVGELGLERVVLGSARRASSSQALVRRQCGLLCELAHLLTVFVASQWARTGVWQFWGRVVGGLRTDRVESWTGMKGKLRQPLSWPF